MEFLFSILVTKIYGQNDDIFYMPDNVEIMVEIPNGFIDFLCLDNWDEKENFKKRYLSENIIQ